MYEEKCACTFLTHVGENSPRSRVARARTETSIPGFRRGILAGYLWKLNPPMLLLGEAAPAGRPSDILGISSSIHRLPILMIAVYQVSSFRAVKENARARAILQPLAVFPPRFPDPSSRPVLKPLSYEFRLNESPEELSSISAYNAFSV